MIPFELHDTTYHNVHFIGIGGVSMSGIAELLHNHGFHVTGSDVRENKYINHLKNVGISVTIGQSAQNIQNQDLFVYTDAILENNEELQAARATGRPLMTRGQFLGQLMKNYPHSIAVSGSHGKSTTTSMIADILIKTQNDPTVLLGGSLDDIGGNVLSGDGEYFLAEACEYKGNIRYYYPKIAIVLNIDEDHLDYFKDLDDIVHAFENYMDNLSEDAIAVINADDPNTRTLLKHVRGTALTYGIENPNAMYNATNVSFDAVGHPSFTLCFPDGTERDFHLNIIGRFNIRNACASIISTLACGIDLDTIQAGIESYHSLHRRMEYLGDFLGAKVLTDYGHHPAEIQATLEALKEQATRKLYCVFQPYTMSRTKTLMNDFARSFHNCDQAIITKIQIAREIDDGSVRSEELVERILQNGDDAVYAAEFSDVHAYLESVAKPGDMILTTGCGNIDELAQELVLLPTPKESCL